MAQPSSPFVGPGKIPFSGPDRSPLYKALPRLYRDLRKLSVYCRGDAAGLRKALPPEFDLASDVFEVFVMNCPVVHDAADPVMGPRSYSEGGIVLHARYRDIVGGHVAYEFVTTDDAMAGGREIMGYPKKLADVTLVEDGKPMTGAVVRLGVELIKVAFEPAEGAFAKPMLQPRLLVKRIPRADGLGYDVNQIVTLSLQRSKVLEVRRGRATAALGGSLDMDPLLELGLREVLGAEFIVGEFDLGYGRVLEDLLRAGSPAALAPVA